MKYGIVSSKTYTCEAYTWCGNDVCSTGMFSNLHCHKRLQRTPYILVLLMNLQIPSIILLFIYVFVWTSVLVIFACFGMPQICFAVTGALLSKITPLQHAATVQSFLMGDVIMSALVGRGLSGLVNFQTRLTEFSVVLLLQWLVSFEKNF